LNATHVTVAPKRLGRWLAIEGDRSWRPLVLYIFTAGMFGILWYFLLFVIPITSQFFTVGLGSSMRRDRPVVFTALVLTSCVISTLFRRPVLHVERLFIPVLAIGLMFLAAGLFTLMAVTFEMLGGEASWEWNVQGVIGFCLTPVWGVLGALYGCWVTVPLATLEVIALRSVTRACRSRASIA